MHGPSFQGDGAWSPQPRQALASLWRRLAKGPVSISSDGGSGDMGTLPPRNGAETHTGPPSGCQTGLSFSPYGPVPNCPGGEALRPWTPSLPPPPNSYSLGPHGQISLMPLLSLSPLEVPLCPPKGKQAWPGRDAAAGDRVIAPAVVLSVVPGFLPH